MLRRIIRYSFLGFLSVVGAATSLMLFVLYTTHTRIYNDENRVPTAQAAMVLGASIKSDGTLSPVLQERADKALALYRAKKVQKILVSGDNGSLAYDEVYPVGQYLERAGVPEIDIFLDYAGFDTYSSMYRAKHVFRVSSLVIVSQYFHLPRAVFIARSVGIEAWGIDAARGEVYAANTLREVPATLKAVRDLVTSRLPQYLGGPFPITGDGRTTWVGSTTQMVQ